MFRSAYLPLSLTLLLGCGGGAPKVVLPETVPVTGTIKLDGNPLAYSTVMFVPTGMTKGIDCIGNTDDSGNYTLKQVRGKDGAPPGEYKVVVSLLKKGDGTPAMKPGAEQKEGEGGVVVESLKPWYSDPLQTQLKATVPAGGGKVDFDLKSK